MRGKGGGGGGGQAIVNVGGLELFIVLIADFIIF